MYCKHCGKQIANDSRFCQYCGGSQDGAATEKKHRKVIEMPVVKTHLSDRAKKWLGIYAIWALLNFLFIFIGDDEHSSEHLWPLREGGLEYYDFSEFLLYVLVLPALALGICKWRRSREKE